MPKKNLVKKNAPARVSTQQKSVKKQSSVSPIYWALLVLTVLVCTFVIKTNHETAKAISADVEFKNQ